MLLDLDLLRAFIAVVESDGFTAAAGRLHRTQSAISMQIARLEELTERRLLQRGRRGVAPTAEGTTLLGYARRMLALNDEAVGELRGNATTGNVRIGTPDD